jgi:hypothetical protein
LRKKKKEEKKRLFREKRLPVSRESFNGDSAISIRIFSKKEDDGLEKKRFD